MDTADDIGVLWIEGELLCFEGDRSILQIARGDVERVSRKRVWTNVLLGHGLDVVVELREPIADQRRFHMSPRHRFNAPWNRGGGRHVRRLVEGWHADGAPGGGAV